MKRFTIGLVASGLVMLGLAGRPTKGEAAAPHTAIQKAAEQTLRPAQAWWRRGYRRSYYGAGYGGYGWSRPYGAYYGWGGYSPYATSYYYRAPVYSYAVPYTTGYSYVTPYSYSYSMPYTYSYSTPVYSGYSYYTPSRSSLWLGY